MAKKKDERFVKVHEESGGILWEKAVFVDRQTGVNYLYIGAGNGGGMLNPGEIEIKASISVTYELAS